MAGLDRARYSRFQELLERDGFDCYLACTPISMGYLADFFEAGGERLLFIASRPTGDPAMIVPALSGTQASHTGISDIRTWCDGEDPLHPFEALARDWNLKSAVIGVDDEMPASFLLPMQASLPAALFKCGGDTMADLRKCKTPIELSHMKGAAQIAEAAFETAIRSVAEGSSEAEVASKLFCEMAGRGGVPTFCIVGTGANGAEPHHQTGQTKLAQGDVVVIDWGCQFSHYHSDITRTVSVGPACDDAKHIYRVVYAAHMAAREAIHPGVPCEDIDTAARKVIEDAGYGDLFIHRTGHGIGLMGHEPPHIVKGSRSALEVGQCFSIEPGIYLPGKFGVRIENLVTVTNDGHESINLEPPAELTEICA